MLSKGDLERLRLFNRYAGNLRLFHPTTEPIFVCPICTGSFNAFSVLHEQLSLDIGHAFPKELGGTKRTLECRACNGSLNAAGDNELIRYHKQWEAMKNPEAETTPVGMILKSGRVNASISARGVNAHWSNSDPDAFQEAIDAISNHTPFRLELPGIDQQRTNLAVVHAAHLVWFAEFGYRYLFTAGGHFVRRLLHGTQRVEDGKFVTMQVAKGDSPPALIFRIGICTFPDGIQCLFTCLPEPNPIYECKIVLLPGLDAEHVEQFAKVVNRADRWMDVAFRTIDGGPARRLAVPEYRDCLARLFKGWEHHQIDMHELMIALYRQSLGDLVRRVDAGPIASSFGIRREVLTTYIAHLVQEGFLQRAPRNRQPFLVKFTKKGSDSVESLTSKS